ncbi:sigma-E factor regulatory protein RseB domain-containing protein [Actinomadura sp. HBU206391]|uniref:sigma-E factor regulatory protein RseB domain-containing protein n=1 Tax=Actinomadura sp. HBU206391 TaxID=2731692 RepID=UPI00164FAEF6|nr:sigma-E factor regulatory protein RseB domain-containing protein [Actinomadura sp. HBU206391]MBC6463494.1 hypothetical protein [Actinomadura sp. HBU206391]
MGGVATALLLLWLMTAGDAVAAPRPGSDPDALRMLSGAAGAARTTAYEGTQITTTWSGKAAATAQERVSHNIGAGTFVRGSSVDRSPVARQAGSEEVHGGLGGFTAPMLDLLARNYSVVRAKDGSVCGRTAHVIEARRADGSPAGRFWIDRDTGLMLHRELLDPVGRVANVTGFRSLRVIRPGEGTAGRHTVATPPGRLLATGELKDLRDRGWTLPRGLPGGLSLREARRSGGVVHLSYSDGLSVVSVFVQPGRLDERRFSRWKREITEGHTVFQQDALHRWAVWGDGGYVYTVLADAPEGTSDAIVAALPHGGSGFWERLGRGFGRLNPFG